MWEKEALRLLLTRLVGAEAFPERLVALAENSVPYLFLLLFQ
jgi:hypothetical protein